MTAARQDLDDGPRFPEVPSRFQPQAPPVRPRPRFEDWIDLVALPSAITVAQLFVARTLHRWGAVFIEPEMLSVTAELVALAVDETGPGGGLPERELLAPIEVYLVGYDRHILIEVVHVHTPEMPSVVSRDLAAVNALARTWGVYPTSSARVVWAELELFGRGGAAVSRRGRKPTPSCLRDLNRSPG